MTLRKGFTLGDWTIHPLEGRLVCEDDERRIPPKSMDVLLHLASASGAVVERDRLLRDVWGERAQSDEPLTRCIGELRRALGETGAEPTYILTVPKRGYQLLKSVEPLHGKTDEPSIAVLPFVNMSDSEENEYFSDGLAEELLTMLTRISSLKVCSRSSSFAYKGKDIHIPSVAEKLGVSTIVEGSVRRVGNQVRIAVQLIDAGLDSHLWARNYERQLNDIFAVQKEIAELIVESLHLTLSLDERRSVTDQTTKNFEAYDYYLRGRDHYHRSDSNHLAAALRMFNKAIELDPDYALAYAGRTYCLADTYQYRQNEEPTLDRANEASLKALALAGHLAESHTARGLVLMSAEDFAEAESAFERALVINPNLFETLHFYSRMARLTGNLPKCLELSQKAAAARPVDFQANSQIGHLLHQMGSHAEADVAWDTAIAQARKAIEIDPTHSRAMCFLALLMRRRGIDEEESRQWTERALATAPDIPGTAYNVGCFHALGGDADKAIDYLERAYDLGDRLKRWFETDPDLDSIRDHPRFKALMDRF